MAEVLGKSGRYVSDEAAKRSSKIVVTGMIAFGSLAFICGVLCGSLLRWFTLNGWYCLVIGIVPASAALWVVIWMRKRFAVLENERNAMRRGVKGESIVAAALSRFPDTFRIINDLNAEYGNVDHVVVGPTGVFLLDAKDWRGTVEADGNEELLLNGEPTNKRYVKQFTGRVMGLRKKVNVLAPKIDPFFQAVFVFTSAAVKAKWGKTGHVHCIKEEQLWDYIVEKKFGKKLSGTEVELIAQAFANLARMDSGFQSESAPVAADAVLRKPSDNWDSAAV